MSVRAPPKLHDVTTGGPRPAPPSIGTAMLLTVAFVGAWATVEAIASTLLRHYSPFQVVWSRYAVHLMFMLALWGWRRPGSLWRTRRPVFQWTRSMLMLAMPASWVLGSGAGVNSSTLMAVFWLSPCLIVVLARIFLGERAPRSVWLASGAGLVGSLALLLPRSLPAPALFVFPVAMALSFSAYVVMTRSLRTESTRVNLFYSAFGVFTVLSVFMPHVWIAPQGVDLLRFAAIGLLGYVTLWALDLLAAAAPVSLTAPLTYLQLVFTGVFGVVSTDTMPSRLEIGGAFLIVAASIGLFLRARSIGPPRAA